MHAPQSGRTAHMDNQTPAAVTSSAIRASGDLDKLTQDFNSWQEAAAGVSKENHHLCTELKSLQKQCVLHQQAVKASSDDNAQLRETIERLHAILSKRCNFEDENAQLKEQIAAMQTSATQLELEHKLQMAEALDNLQAVHEAHKKEISEIQDAANQQMRRELEVLQRTIQERNGEVRQLQKQLTDLERDKHTEVVKLRLEYDAKLLKLQKQNSKNQCGQSSTSSINHDIFRRKLQHAKAESDREIAALKRQVSDLERQLATVNKRRRL